MNDLSAVDSVINGDVLFESCTFGINSSISLRGSKIEKKLHFKNIRCEAIDISGVKVDGDLILDNTVLTASVSCFKANHAIIKEDFAITESSFFSSVDLRHAHFYAFVYFLSGQCGSAAPIRDLNSAIDLSSSIIEKGLVFTKEWCHFGTVALNSAKIHSDANLNCSIRAIQGNDALTANSITVSGNLMFGERFECLVGDLNVSNSKIGGNVHFANCVIGNLKDSADIVFSKATISGSFKFHHNRMFGQLLLDSASILHDVSLFRSDFIGSKNLPSIVDFSKSTIGSISLSRLRIHKGSLRTNSTVIDGLLDIQSCFINPSNGTPAIFAFRLKVHGGINIGTIGRSRFKGKIDLDEASILGNLLVSLHCYVNDALLRENPDVGDFSAIDSEVSGQVLFRDARLGSLRMDGVSSQSLIVRKCNLKGVIDCDNSSIGSELNIVNSECHAFRGNDAEINSLLLSSSLFRCKSKNEYDSAVSVVSSVLDVVRITNNCTFNGSIRMLMINVKSQMHFRDVTVLSDAPFAIELRRSKIDDIISFDSNVSVNNRILIDNSVIKHDVRFHGLRLLPNVKHENFVSLSGASIGSNVLFQRSEELGTEKESLHCSIAGSLRLDNTKIAGTLDFSGLEFISDENNQSINEINAVNLVVGEKFVLKDIRNNSCCTINLMGAHVNVLDDSIDEWREFDSYNMNGFTYEKFFSFDLLDEKMQDKREEWITNHSLGNKKFGFIEQPYIQLENVYHSIGDEAAAKSIRIVRQQDRRKFGRLTSTSRIWNFLLDKSISYGDNLWRAVLALLIVYATSVALVATAKSDNLLIPVGSTAVVIAPEFPKSEVCTNQYPCVNEFLYPVDAALPFINLHQSDYWQFSEISDKGLYIELSFAILTLLGWLFSSLLVAGLAGIIKT
jgi:hypothetical protein